MLAGITEIHEVEESMIQRPRASVSESYTTRDTIEENELKGLLATEALEAAEEEKQGMIDRETEKAGKLGFCNGEQTDNGKNINGMKEMKIPIGQILKPELGQKFLWQDDHHRVYLIDNGKKYVIEKFSDYPSAMKLPPKPTPAEVAMGMISDWKTSRLKSATSSRSLDKEDHLPSLLQKHSSVTDGKRRSQNLGFNGSGSVVSSTTYEGEEANIIGTIADPAVLTTTRQVRMQPSREIRMKPSGEIALESLTTYGIEDISQLGSSTILEWPGCEITIGAKGQLVVDPKSAKTFLIRELHYTFDGDDSSNLKDLNNLGLVPASGVTLPLTHPLSGRKFDIQTFDGKELAAFEDPALCMAAVKKALLNTNADVKASKEYIWRRTEMQKSVLEFATPVAPWLRVDGDEKVAVDIATQDAFVLSPILGFTFMRRRGDKVGMMKDPSSGVEYVRLSNFAAYEVVSGRYWNWQEAGARTMEQQSECITSARHTDASNAPMLSASVLDTAALNTEEFLNEQIQRQQEGSRLVDGAFTLYEAFKDNLEENYEREVEIRNQAQFHILPNTLLVIERVTSATYIANEVACTSPDRIYTESDVADALEFATERKMSIRGDEGDSDDSPYLLSIDVPNGGTLPSTKLAQLRSNSIISEVARAR